jgi:hypothetical protein
MAQRRWGAPRPSEPGEKILATSARWMAPPITGTGAARAPGIRRGSETLGKKSRYCPESKAWPGGRAATRQTKILNSPNLGIEDCTRLAWSSSRRPGRVSQPRTSSLQAGLLALGLSYSRRLPGAHRNPSGRQPVSSPITAAGPRRFSTVFPVIPGGTCKSALLLTPLSRSVKGNRRGPAEDQGVPLYPQGPGHGGTFGLEQEPDAGVIQMTHSLKMPHALGQDEAGGLIEFPEARGGLGKL